MHLFYAPEITGSTHTLQKDESRHCIKVLRLKGNDAVHLTDGRGNLFLTIIEDPDPEKCRLRIIETFRDYQRKPWNLHIAIAPPKSPDRLEWFLEKVTEIGINEITPVFCTRSERRIVNLSRMEKVLIAAMKQSLKAFLPVLHEPYSFRDFISRPFAGQKFIAYCETGPEKELYQHYLAGSDVLILIGPEGDFSGDEIIQAKMLGFVPIKLGKSRLRTETAGLVACHTINLINQMYSAR